MADFHSEVIPINVSVLFGMLMICNNSTLQLELLNEAQMHQNSVAFCAKLDQLLMVGSYDQVSL